jgi:hypothetical protein
LVLECQQIRQNHFRALALFPLLLASARHKAFASAACGPWCGLEAPLSWIGLDAALRMLVRERRKIFLISPPAGLLHLTSISPICRAVGSAVVAAAATAAAAVPRAAVGGAIFPFAPSRRGLPAPAHGLRDHWLGQLGRLGRLGRLGQLGHLALLGPQDLLENISLENAGQLDQIRVGCRGGHSAGERGV